MLLKLLEVTIIVAGFFAIQNLSRLFKPGFRLVSLSVAQVCYAVLVYLRNPIFNFSPHLKGFLPFALLFILTLFLGRFLGAAAASVQFRPTVINFLTLGLLLPVSEA